MGPDCPPPPPPPPPNNNNNNNSKPSGPKSTCVPNVSERRREEISEEISSLREKVSRQYQENSSLQNQVQRLSQENSSLREQMEPPAEEEEEKEEKELEQLQEPPQAQALPLPQPQQPQPLPLPQQPQPLPLPLPLQPQPLPQPLPLPLEPEEEDDELELRGAAAAAAPPPPIEEECPEDLPEKFDGNPDMLAPFMSQCQLFMEKSTRDFSLDRVRVCFVTSMMTGRAARWASAKLERSHYLMHNYPAFMMELKHVFEDPQRREAAKRKIRRLRQGMGSVVDYSNAFQMIAQDLDWNEPALIDQYHEGLSDHIQEELSHLEAAKTLSALIGQCIHIERRLARAAAARKPRSPPRALVMPNVSGHHQVDPTEPVGGARMRLTQEEKERRRKLNLCLYCGTGGHYADNCPAKASKSPPAGNSPAPL